jgi:hypothetical protein
MVVIYFTDLAKERLLRIIKDSVKQKSYKQPWCTVLKRNSLLRTARIYQFFLDAV